MCRFFHLRIFLTNEPWAFSSSTPYSWPHYFGHHYTNLFCLCEKDCSERWNRALAVLPYKYEDSDHLGYPISAYGLFQRLSISGSLIGGLSETQEMLDFCGKHNIPADVEVIPIKKVNEAY